MANYTPSGGRTAPKDRIATDGDVAAGSFTIAASTALTEVLNPKIKAGAKIIITAASSGAGTLVGAAGVRVSEVKAAPKLGVINKDDKYLYVASTTGFTVGEFVVAADTLVNVASTTGFTAGEYVISSSGAVGFITAVATDTSMSVVTLTSARFGDGEGLTDSADGSTLGTATEDSLSVEALSGGIGEIKEVSTNAYLRVQMVGGNFIATDVIMDSSAAIPAIGTIGTATEAVTGVVNYSRNAAGFMVTSTSGAGTKTFNYVAINI